ncbi:MAG: LytR C-terminal domain-containing protein [Candidatus Adiutrix sp.]|jgi:hypothetical protein|nr:LytR C-terminal domain-containing protein [Candidatus Adiutrix sp.]
MKTGSDRNGKTRPPDFDPGNGLVWPQHVAEEAGGRRPRGLCSCARPFRPPSRRFAASALLGLTALLFLPSPLWAQTDPPAVHGFALDDEAEDEKYLDNLFQEAAESAAPDESAYRPPAADAGEPRAAGAITLPAAAPPRPAESESSGAGRLVAPIERVSALPDPQWRNVDPDNLTPRPAPDAPQPQFDAAQGRWKQLEVGQIDSPLPSGTPDPAENAPPAGSASPRPAYAPENPPAAAARALEPAEREHLRNLFSDMLPPEPLGTQANSTPAAPAGANSSPAASPAASSAAARPASTFAPTNAESTSSAAAGSNAGAPEPRAPEDNPGGSAILKAGGLLSVEKQFGAAEILPPLDPASLPTPKAAPKANQGRPKTAAARTSAPQNAVAPVKRFNLSLINETGNARVAEIYSSVLSQIGYTVSSVSHNPPGGGPAGQTIISYPAGQKARAQDLARHLPGRKTLTEAQGTAEISVRLR